jgi:hypothetical protein
MIHTKTKVRLGRMRSKAEEVCNGSWLRVVALSSQCSIDATTSDPWRRAVDLPLRTRYGCQIVFNAALGASYSTRV